MTAQPAPIVAYFRAILPRGLELLNSKAAASTSRMIRQPRGRFFDDATLLDLTNHFATVLTISDLIGRWRINSLARDRGYLTFAEEGIVPWTPEDLARMFRPQQAIDFFRSIMPIDFDLPLFDTLINGRAFTIAATADKIIQQRVADVIDERLETGKQVRAAGRDIDEILDESGIAHTNGYGTMVYRTNAMESYRNGSWEQFTKPSLREAFPAWQYIGIPDGRERQGPEPEKPDHHAHFRKFWPRGVSFFDVRGRLARDVINCRCDFVPIDTREWARFAAKGARLEVSPLPSWPIPAVRQEKSLPQF